MLTLIETIGPKGRKDFQALGLSFAQQLRYVIVPQAMRAPALPVGSVL